MRYIIEYKGVFLMVLSQVEMRSRAEIFIEEYKDVSDEHSFAQHFWRDFLHIFGVHWKDVAVFEQAVKKFTGAQGFIDCFWKGKVVIEHKSRGKNLTKAFTQAMGYLDTLSSEEKPRYVIVSDFERIRLTDLYNNKKNEIHLSELPDNLQMFKFIYEDETNEHETQEELNIEASELMGTLYDSLKDDGYEEEYLELFLVRLLFCVYAEDTGIFEPFQFTDYILNEEDVMNVGTKIQMLFRILDQPKENRQNSIGDELKAFPYVNGKLFETPIVPPVFTPQMYRILRKICNFDWSKISPAIFGSLFQSIIDPKLRRELGAHYTSESNILKVVNSLFMNDLWEEFYNAKGVSWKLEQLWDKIGELEFLDPACGCGNFLIVAYKELRLLEFEILSILLNLDRTQIRFDTKSLSKIKLEHFHGIEIEEFPCMIAKLSMWLVQHQMDLKYESIDIHEDNLPLKTSMNIYNENALRIDWSDIVAPSDNLFILGNPPFAGKKDQTSSQKEDMKIVFNGFKKVGVLDYVTAWYKKALDYIEGTKIKVGFVSTSSITQGEQVSALWKQLNEKYSFFINFAHQPFKWTNEARNNAAVIVIIIGFSSEDKKNKILFRYSESESQQSDNNTEIVPEAVIVDHINHYLIDFEDIFIDSISNPICNVPKIQLGNMANDNGGLIIKTNEEKRRLISKYPILEKYIKTFIGGKEFINGDERYCLWLADDDSAILDIGDIPEISERFRIVKEHRQKSTRPQTRELADLFMLFGEIRQPSNDYILIPLNTASSRKYIPIGIVNKDIIVSNLASFVDSNDLSLFGILHSKMHMTWVDFVAGRLGDQYRYSNNVVYNNFPFPELTDSDRENIAIKAEEILKIREKFANRSLFDLYGRKMPQNLINAHKELDNAVDKAYRTKKFTSDDERMEFLFHLYLEYTSNNI